MLEQKELKGFFLEELIRTTRTVVETGLKRVREGYINKHGVQDIYLKEEGNIIFKLRNDGVKKTQGLLSSMGFVPPLSVGRLETGLFIFGLKLNKEEYPSPEPAYSLLLPRNPLLVVEDNVARLSGGLSSSQMRELEEKIRTAKWVPFAHYRRIYEKFLCLAPKPSI